MKKGLIAGGSCILVVAIAAAVYWKSRSADDVYFDLGDPSQSNNLTAELGDESGKSTGDTATVLFTRPAGSSVGYGVFQGKLYALKEGAKTARLLGPYAKYLALARLQNGRSVTISVTEWGADKTFFIVNGKTHAMGRNGRFVVVGDEILLADDTSDSARRLDSEGTFLGKTAKPPSPAK